MKFKALFTHMSRIKLPLDDNVGHLKYRYINGLTAPVTNLHVAVFQQDSIDGHENLNFI